MGAWGHQFDENDDAGDWLSDFADAPSWSDVEAALKQAADADYLEAPEASVAVAAAEIVAASRGKPSPRLPNEIVVWAAAKAGGSDVEDNKASAAVARVRDDSELAELWGESGEADDWRSSLDELAQRLN